MTVPIHQGQVLARFMKDHKLKAVQVAKTIGVERTYFYTLLAKESIPTKPLTALKEKYRFDPDTYVSNQTTDNTPINIHRVKIPGSSFKSAMKKSKLHVDRAAELLGVSRSTVIRYSQKPELESHVIDLIKEKLGIDLESGLKAEQPVESIPAVTESDESALMEFGTTMFKKFQTIKNLSSIVQAHETDISQLKFIVNKQDKRIDGVALEIHDLVREHQELQRVVQNIKKK